ncbi:hypothetical protein ACFL2V_08320 [Pseudomonadota bacterium]
MALEDLTPKEELTIKRGFAERMKLKLKGKKNPEKMSDAEIEAEIAEIGKRINALLNKDPETVLKAINLVLSELVKEYPQFSIVEMGRICGISSEMTEGMKFPKHWKERQRKVREKVNARKAAYVEKLDQMSLDELIASCKDPKQKSDWERIRKINFPQPKKKVKIVRIVGGTKLNDNGELDSQVDELVDGFRKIYPTGKMEIVTIPYDEGSTGKEALELFQAEMDRDDADIIIPVFSGHGGNNPPEDPEGEFIFHSNTLDRRTRPDKGISSSDLMEVARKNNGKKFLFIIDACYAGSATDDLLADEVNVFGILATVSRDKVSSIPFTSNFGRYLGKGMQLGEAFIRADAAIRGPMAYQNPAAMFNDGNEKIVAS